MAKEFNYSRIAETLKKTRAALTPKLTAEERKKYEKYKKKITGMGGVVATEKEYAQILGRTGQRKMPMAKAIVSKPRQTSKSIQQQKQEELEKGMTKEEVKRRGWSF